MPITALYLDLALVSAIFLVVVVTVYGTFNDKLFLLEVCARKPQVY